MISISVPDRVGRLEALGRLLIYTNQLDEAHSTFLELFRYQRANKTYLLCALATHPVFRHGVVFPKCPNSARHSSSPPFPTKNITPVLNGDDSNHVANKSTDESVAVHEADENRHFLTLSLYALGSCDLHCSLSEGWLAHPRHIIFKGTPRDFKRACPDHLMYNQSRPLTSNEEKSLSNWFLSGNFHPQFSLCQE